MEGSFKSPKVFSAIDQKGIRSEPCRSKFLKGTFFCIILHFLSFFIIFYHFLSFFIIFLSFFIIFYHFLSFLSFFIIFYHFCIFLHLKTDIWFFLIVIDFFFIRVTVSMNHIILVYRRQTRHPPRMSFRFDTFAVSFLGKIWICFTVWNFI